MLRLAWLCLPHLCFSWRTSNEQNSSLGQDLGGQVSVRHGLVIHGHSNLHVLKVYTLKPSSDGKCHEVLGKVERLADDELGKGGDMTAASRFLSDAEERRGSEVLQEAEEVLDQADLKAVLGPGELVSGSDLNTLLECEVGKEGRLEEHRWTAEGEGLFEGDIVVPHDVAAAGLLQSGTGGRWAGTLWPEKLVHYCYAQGISSAAKEAWDDALKHLKKQVPCLEFVQVDAKGSSSCAQMPAILVQSSGSGCYSSIGMESKGQRLNLGLGCEEMGVAAHELGHALGMAHEQARPDRDRFVTVHWENIQEEGKSQFSIDKRAYREDEYDPYSLMHYEPYAFSKNEEATITGKVRGVTRVLGQRMGFSESDIRQIGKMYGCPVRPLIQTADLAAKLVGGSSSGPGPGPETYTRIRVVIRRATDLPTAEYLGFERTPDPYLNIYHGKTKLKTKTVKGTRNPVWNESFTLHYNPSEKLRIKIKTKAAWGWLMTTLADIQLKPHMFFPVGPCNDGCHLNLKYGIGGGPKLEACLSVCNDRGCSCAEH